MCDTNHMIHNHLSYWVTNSSPVAKLKCSKLGNFPLPFAWATTDSGECIFAIGISNQKQYKCKHSECKDLIQHLNRLSPHSSVVDECKRCFPQFQHETFCAGYATIDNCGMITTNQNSGHFGQNWTIDNQRALTLFLQKRKL